MCVHACAQARRAGGSSAAAPDVALAALASLLPLCFFEVLCPKIDWVT